jgi:hypothetical protein
MEGVKQEKKGKLYDGKDLPSRYFKEGKITNKIN